MPAKKPPVLFHLAPVALAVTDGTVDVRSDIETKSGNEPRWLQVAAEGTFEGHPAGPFELNAEVFGELIENFHGHPAFTPGADGTGTGRVIAFDFHHASEDAPATVAVLGAPAQAWALDLETRKVDGKDTLWALTEMLEPMATYAKEGKYAWTSVAIWPNATNPETGDEIGWYLSSIAFTNDPFIQGMQPVAAQRAALLGSYYDPYDPPSTVDQLLQALKGTLELPETSTVADIAAELGKLRQFAEGAGEPPAGVDVDGLCGRLRQLLNLPLLTPPAEVFVELEKVLALAEGAQPPEPVPTAPALPPAAAPAIAKRESTMDLLKKLAGRFGIPATEAEVEARLFASLDEGQEAATGLSKLLGLLGVKNLEQAKGKLQELMGLKDIMPTIEALLQGEVEIEEKAVDEDVAAVVATYKVPAVMTSALKTERAGGVETLAIDGCMLSEPGAKSPLELRRAAREKFRKQYPEAFITADRRHLLADVATEGPKSPILRSLTNVGGGVQFDRKPSEPLSPEGPPGERTGGQSKIAEDVMRCAGRNHVEKAMNYLASQPGGDTEPFDHRHERACLLCRELKLDQRRTA